MSLAISAAAAANGRDGRECGDGGDNGGGDGGGGDSDTVTATTAMTGKAMVMVSREERLLTAAYAEGGPVHSKLPFMLDFLEWATRVVNVLQGRCIRRSSGESYGDLCTTGISCSSSVVMVGT